jgi:hypothetical protein
MSDPHAIRTVALAHQRDILEQMPVRQLADEAPAEIAQILRQIIDWLAEHRLSQTHQEAA